MKECQKIRALGLETRFCHSNLTSRFLPGMPGEASDMSSIGGSKMGFRPLHDRLVVRRVEADEKTAGGIIIPDTAKEKPAEGEVVAVGPGARNEKGEIVALDVRPGDRVLFGKWSGTEVRINGEDLLIMKETDILGIIEPAETARKAA
jgi:chaperonin GroES